MGEWIISARRTACAVSMGGRWLCQHEEIEMKRARVCVCEAAVVAEDDNAALTRLSVGPAVYGDAATRSDSEGR